MRTYQSPRPLGELARPAAGPDKTDMPGPSVLAGQARLGPRLARRLLLPGSRPWIPGMTRRADAHWITRIWGVIW